MQPILDVITILCIGLMIGAEFTVSAFINPILQQLGASAQAHATQLFARKLGAIMPFWYALSLLLLIAETIIAWHAPGMAFLVSASAIWVAVIVFTLMFLVPINNRIANAESGAFTPALRRHHTQWDILHRGRVLALSVAMICMLVGIRM